MAEVYENKDYFDGTLDPERLTPPILHTQKSEFEKLRGIIKALSEKKGSPLSILDIGIGDARVLKLIVDDHDTWDKIQHYDAIDVAKNCVEKSKRAIQDLHVEEEVTVKHLDAVHLKQLGKTYDLIFLTFFTAGNFYPEDFDFAQAKRYDLSMNEKFTTIFKQAYEMLNKHGEIVIGSVYINTKETKEKQEHWYNGLGWGVKFTHGDDDSFVSTMDGWWSQRFTKEQIYTYLDFIPKEKISFVPLDGEDFAMMIRIKK